MDHGTTPAFLPTWRETIPMEIEVCSQQDDFVALTSQTTCENSQIVEGTPIQSQILPMNELDLASSQCSIHSAINMDTTPVSTRKGRKKKGYAAKNARTRAANRRRRLFDEEYRIAENERRLESFQDNIQSPIQREEHNRRQLVLMKKRLEDADERKKHNQRQLELMTERLQDPVEREKHNKRQLERLEKSC